MSSHLPGFQSFSRVFASFCIGQISHQQPKGKCPPDNNDHISPGLVTNNTLVAKDVIKVIVEANIVVENASKFLNPSNAEATFV